MSGRLHRPAPYTPLSVTFATGKTGTAIREKFGLEGLGVWAAMLAAAKQEEGLIVFRHEDDWGAIGLAGEEPNFTLKELLRRLGQLKQTRTTRQGHVLYVELTQWERWTDIKDRANSAWRKSRNREQSNRDKDRDTSGTSPGQERDTTGTPPSLARALDLDVDVEVNQRPAEQSRSDTTQSARPADEEAQEEEELGWSASNGFDIPTPEQRPNFERDDAMERL